MPLYISLPSCRVVVSEPLACFLYSCGEKEGNIKTKLDFVECSTLSVLQYS